MLSDQWWRVQERQGGPHLAGVPRSDLVRLLRHQYKLTLLPTSEVCRRYGLPACHQCEDADCSDNQTPSILRLKDGK